MTGFNKITLFMFFLQKNVIFEVFIRFLSRLGLN